VNLAGLLTCQQIAMPRARAEARSDTGAYRYRIRIAAVRDNT
jgi:hypothetical protein